MTPPFGGAIPASSSSGPETAFKFVQVRAMNVTELGFLMAGALAVTAGLTAPLRPDMLARKESSTSRALLAAIGCVAACDVLIIAAPAMLQDTPVAAVLALSLVHVGVTAWKWRRERLIAAPQAGHRRSRLTRTVA